MSNALTMLTCQM